MKKQLLCFSMFANIVTHAQVQSPDWATTQNTNFPQTAAGIRYLDAVDANVVWATGYDGLSSGSSYNWFTTSSDGGNTFTSGNVFADTNTYIISSIEGINASTAFVTAYTKATGNKGVVYKTSNSGGTWANVAAVNMFTNTASFADFTCFTSPLIGITLGDPVSGEYEIHRTTDGGLTWSQVSGANIPNPLNASEYGLTGVYTKNGNHIWFGSNNGRVYHSSDAGLTWTVGTITGATVGVSRLAFRDNLNGLCIAFSGTTASPVTGLYKTTDGGSTWTNIGVSSTFGQNDICAIPGTSTYASCGAGTGNNIISYSTDDGATWVDWGSTNIQYLNVDFVDNITGWAGTFSDQATASVGGIYKYSGTATSLIPFANKHEFNVFPNPSNGLVSFVLPAAKSGCLIEVIDILGKVVYSERMVTTNVGDKKQINLSFLSKGLYSINIKNGNESSVSKVIID